MDHPVFVAYRKSTDEPMFAFHAPDLATARSMLHGWVRSRGFVPSDNEYGVRETSDHRAELVPMRDDYVDHGRSIKTLRIYQFVTEDDEHPLMIECHRIFGTVTEAKVRGLLAEASASSFYGPFEIVTASSSSPNYAPAFKLASVSQSGRVLIACRE